MATTPDVAALYAKARRLVASIEYQLQQLEEAGPGIQAGADEARHALAENVNSLHTEIGSLERAIAESYGAGVGATNQKAQLWRK